MLEKLRSLDVELYLSQQPCNEEHLMLVVVLTKQINWLPFFYCCCFGL
jgi:hypothetical protein